MVENAVADLLVNSVVRAQEQVAIQPVAGQPRATARAWGDWATVANFTHSANFPFVAVAVEQECAN
jgi:hypothetical protein